MVVDKCSLNKAEVHRVMSQYFGFALYKSAQLMKSQFDDLLSQDGMETQQYGILVILNQFGSVSQTELSQLMLMDQASLVRFLDGLEKLKYIERNTDPQDRRAKQISLTDRGLKARISMRKEGERIENEFLKSLTKSEQTSLKKILSKLIRHHLGQK